MTGAESLRWLIKSPPCCHCIGSIWFLNLLVSPQTIVDGSRFHWLTTLCEKKYFRLLRWLYCLVMVYWWPLRPALRSGKKSSRLRPSRLCIILYTSIRSLLRRLISRDISFLVFFRCSYSSSSTSLIILVILRCTPSMLLMSCCRYGLHACTQYSKSEVSLGSCTGEQDYSWICPRMSFWSGQLSGWPSILPWQCDDWGSVFLLLSLPDLFPRQSLQCCGLRWYINMMLISVANM